MAKLLLCLIAGGLTACASALAYHHDHPSRAAECMKNILVVTCTGLDAGFIIIRNGTASLDIQTA